MIAISKTCVSGLEAAIRGMRNPLESWDLSDSFIGDDGEFIIGDADKKLCNILAKHDDEGKYLRMIHCSIDIDAPVYWIAELDTYKIATTRNSGSMMHKGTSRKYEFENFSIPQMDKMSSEQRKDFNCVFTLVVAELNKLVKAYHEETDKEAKEQYFLAIRSIMPMGYNYHFTYDCDYQSLRHIYHARKNHRLPEWKRFCRWIENLPYSELITGSIEDK